MSIGTLNPAMRPWQIFDFPDEHKQTIYRDWGQFYAQRLRESHAISCFNNSLALKEDDWVVLSLRSKCYRALAKPQVALKDGRRADYCLTLTPENRNMNVDIEISNALFDLNQFENCCIETSNSIRRYSKRKVTTLKNRLIVLEQNIFDALRESLGPFILENESFLEEIAEIIKTENTIDDRPLWKKLKAEGKCDATSIVEKPPELVSPLEAARRKRLFQLRTENYLNKSWNDVVFMKQINNPMGLLLPYCNLSTPILRHLVTAKYDIIKTFTKMLQCRSPMYNERYWKTTNKKLAEKEREASLNRIQYRTHRDMIRALRKIRAFREAREIDNLVKFIEEFMGDYVALKTSRVMPWKFEFTNEMYNTLALAFIDQLIETELPCDLLDLPESARLIEILKIPSINSKERPERFEFGNRSTYMSPDELDPATIKYMKYIARLEKRLLFAKYSIEKCYLLHEMARSHLMHNRHDECLLVARKAIRETVGCKSFIWRFLSFMLIIKSNTILHKIERNVEAFEAAIKITVQLKSPKLTHFVNVCRIIVEHEFLVKKQRKSLASLQSHISVIANKQPNTKVRPTIKSKSDDDSDED